MQMFLYWPLRLVQDALMSQHHLMHVHHVYDILEDCTKAGLGLNERCIPMALDFTGRHVQFLL